MSRFSKTLICEKTRRPSGHSAMPRSTTLWDFTPTILCPLNSMEPESGLMRPATVLSVVDLPAPLAPMGVTVTLATDAPKESAGKEGFNPPQHFITVPQQRKAATTPYLPLADSCPLEEPR